MLLNNSAPRGPSTRWRRGRLPTFCALALSLVVPSLLHADDAVGEFEIKAAFLFNIAKYAKWPATSFSDPSAPLIIGVLGRDPLGGSLDRVVQNRQIDGRRVVVRRGSSPAEMKGCHLVFIADSERDRLLSTCAALESMRILTVGDGPQSATAVTFDVQGGRLGFTVSLPATERAKVQISAKLLKLAKHVIRHSGGTVARYYDP